MHDPGALRRDAPGEQVIYLVEQSEQGQILRDGRDGGVHLGVPAPELPFDVSGAAHRLAQAEPGPTETGSSECSATSTSITWSAARSRADGGSWSPAARSASTRPSTNPIT